MTQSRPDRTGLPVNVPHAREVLRVAGVTDAELRRDHTRLMRGQWLHGEIRPEWRHLLVAALQRAPDDAFLTHDTAASVLQGVAPSSGVIQLGTASGKRVRAGGMVVHRYAARPATVMVGDLPVTSKAQTFLDLAPLLSLVDLVVLGDSLSLHDSGLPGVLRRAAQDATGRGAIKARRAAGLVRVGAESPQETRTRLLIVLAGLLEPTLQHPLEDERGREIHRLDMAYPENLLAIEYDGEHHFDRDQRHRDELRREKFEDDGWRFVLAVSADLYRRPGAFLDRVVKASRERGIQVPKRLNPQWRLHFPA